MSDDIFESFPARAYLEKYYSYVGSENAAWLESILRSGRRLKTGDEGSVIEVGGGPLAAPILALTAVGFEFQRVEFTDIADQNLNEARAWASGSPKAFNLGVIAEWLCEESADFPDPAKLVAQCRALTWSFSLWDARQLPPSEWRGAFDVVSSHFFAESATSDRGEMRTLLRHVGMLAATDAIAVFSFMKNSSGYVVDGIRFPAVSVDEDSVLRELSYSGIELEDVEIVTTPTEDPPTRPGYEGMFFVSGRFAR